MRHLIVAIAVLLLIASPGRAAGDGQAAAPQAPAQSPGESSASRITFDYSTAPLWRNAALSDAAWAAFALGVDWGLDTLTRDRFTARSSAGVASRTARWALLDVPMAWYTFVWTHEYGHETRITEAGLPARVVVHGTPWTGLTAFTETSVPVADSTPAMYSAGIEGTNVLLRRLERRLLQSGDAHHAELSAIFVATGMSFGYIQRDLSAGRVRQGAIFRSPDPGDPSGYVITLAHRRFAVPTLEQFQDLADGIRNGSWLSLIDYQLVTVGVGLFRDYLVRGERQTPVRWITLGGVSLVPGLRYEMTPVGPERQVRSWIRIGPRVAAAYVRWTDTVDDQRLLGAGGEYRSLPMGRWRLGMMFDFWENPDDPAAARYGARYEANADWSPPAARWSLTLAAGGKSTGYLIGFPIASGAYGSVGEAIRF